MSTYLWVEDFENGRCGDYAFNLFGEILQIDLNLFPDSENALKAFLRTKNIFLETNYSDASRFINDRKKLETVDFVILDIDLRLTGIDFEEDEEKLKPILEKWYDYEPKSPIEAESLNKSKFNMKKMAGYHLYTDLLINLRFPKKHILFCSDHADYLISVAQSFNGAKMSAPIVFSKSDERLNPAIKSLDQDIYIRLRRSILSACTAISNELVRGTITYTIPQHSRSGSAELTSEDGESLLGILPLLLPSIVEPGTPKNLIFRQFLRALTQDWDKIRFENASIDLKAFASILVSCRNWTSHSNKALTQLGERDMAFIFLLLIRSSFSLDPNTIETYEVDLLDILGSDTSINIGLMKQKLDDSYEELNILKNRLPRSRQSEFDGYFYFDFKANFLHENDQLLPGEHEVTISRMFFHRLINPSAEGKHSPKLSDFGNSKFMTQFTRRVFHRAFE